MLEDRQTQMGKELIILTLAKIQTKSRRQEEAVLTQMRGLGGLTFALGESQAEVIFNSGLPESATAVLYLPVLQLMAFYRSLNKGLNPDQPHNLTKVIELEHL